MPLIRKDAVQPARPAPPNAQALLSGDRDQRWNAARAMSGAEHVTPLAEALAREADANVREAILTSLCRIATQESIAAIAQGVRSDNASVRRGALDALRSVPDLARPILPALLADSDADVRLLSCEVARALPADQATAILSNLLSAEGEANVCASAVDVLADIGAAEAEPALRAAAQRFPAEPFLQFAIAGALERIKAAREAPS